MTLDLNQTGKRESGDDRRVAIALAARAIIVEKGLEGLRTRDIAARVGINIATLHYHVPSKEALIALVAESIRADFRAQSQRHPRDGKTALQQLHMEFDDFRESVGEMPDLIIILTELIERARRDPVVAEIMLPVYWFWRNQITELFRLGLLDGSFRSDLDPEAASMITTGALSDCWRHSSHSLSDLDRMLAELERAFLPPILPKDKPMSADTHNHGAHAAPDPRRWLALFVLLIANFMNLIDVTIVNVALPSMRESLGATDSQIEWVIAAYILAFALGLLPFGRLGDILGRTRLFLWGVAGFTAASALCGLAPNIEFLIVARIIQGLAGAMMTPQVLAIATVTFPPHERGQAFSLFGLSAGLASVCGPILGGVLVSANLFGMEWQPIFLVNIPIGIAAVIAGWFLIPRLPGHAALKNDYVGIVLFGLGILAVVFPIVEGRTYGWPLWAFGMMAAGIALLVLFVLWTRSRAAAGQSQLLNFDLITNRQFMFGAFVMTVFASGIPGMFMVISLLLQGGFAFTPLKSGLTNTPFSVGVLAASLIAGRFGSSYLRGRLATSGALLVLGIGWLHFYIAGVSDSIDHWQFLPPLLLAGIGLGLGFSALFQLVLANVPPRDAGAGSGALQAFQQVGGALGVALIGEIFFSNLGTSFAGGASQHAAFSTASSLALWYVVASFALVLVLAPFFKKPPAQPHRGGAPAQPVLVEV